MALGRLPSSAFTGKFVFSFSEHEHNGPGLDTEANWSFEVVRG